jgi:hypothetical protein
MVCDRGSAREFDGVTRQLRDPLGGARDPCRGGSFSTVVASSRCLRRVPVAGYATLDD